MTLVKREKTFCDLSWFGVWQMCQDFERSLSQT